MINRKAQSAVQMLSRLLGKLGISSLHRTNKIYVNYGVKAEDVGKTYPVYGWPNGKSFEYTMRVHGKAKKGYESTET